MANIRKATLEDLPSITKIYNYEVLNGVATFDIHPKTTVERAEWFGAHSKEIHPIFVAEENGEVVGYASLSPYRDKEAYNATVELSVYTDPYFRGHGIGISLMREILDFAKKSSEIHTVVSVITSGNEVSVHLHEKFGFEFCGHLSEVGMKFGKYQSTDTYVLVF